MKLELKVYSALPCETKMFIIDGVDSDENWFVNNYDDGRGKEIEYGCNNRVTKLLRISEVRNNLPESLKDLSVEEIEEIQNRLEEELVSGGCGWCV